MLIKAVKKRTLAALCSALLLLAAAASAPAAVHTLSHEKTEEKKFIKWVDFNVPYEALSAALELDIQSHREANSLPLSWIDVLAYLAAKYGGDFSYYKKSDLEKLTKELNAGAVSIDSLGAELKTYAYFKEAYSAVLAGFAGEYAIETPQSKNAPQTPLETQYGLKAFSPIAEGYNYSHYDDFGVSRSYGYKRRHLGHDMLCSVGTPVIAVESGFVECVGWNQYGGWRIGIRSFDRKRYHYYAHLRKDHPYNDMYEGKLITAGDVIGYVGMTGYSAKENVNNINTPHLHYGLQLIFDEETQKDGTNQIWINLYPITRLLEKNRSAVYYDKEQKEYYRKYEMFEESTAE